MKLKISHVGACLPEYWGGHHRAHISICAWPGMTLRAIKEQLRMALRQGAVMGSCRLSHLLSSDIIKASEIKEADQATRAAYAAVGRIRPGKKGQRRFFMDIEKGQMSYFVFMEM